MQVQLEAKSCNERPFKFLTTAPSLWTSSHHSSGVKTPPWLLNKPLRFLFQRLRRASPYWALSLWGQMSTVRPIPYPGVLSGPGAPRMPGSVDHRNLWEYPRRWLMWLTKLPHWLSLTLSLLLLSCSLFCLCACVTCWHLWASKAKANPAIFFFLPGQQHKTMHRKSTGSKFLHLLVV